MIYQEKFDLTEGNQSFFSNRFDIIITGFRDNEDERHLRFIKDLKDFKGTIYCFDVCDEANKFHYRKQDVDGLEILSANDKNLIPDLEKFLRLENIEGSRICIDITAIKQTILFLLIKILMKDVKPSCLFAAYTEPSEYKKKKNDVGETEEFDLYNKIMGSSKGIPGFHKAKGSKPILLIACMGFDSQRLQTIYESLKPQVLIPIVGFPSFVPGWNLTAIKMNYRVLKESNSYDMLESCEAASPFGMFELLKEIYHRQNEEYDIYVCPLGSRPHILGIALFATAYFPNVFLIYDHAVEKKFRSANVLRVNIYDLSKYIS